MVLMLDDLLMKNELPMPSSASKGLSPSAQSGLPSPKILITKVESSVKRPLCKGGGKGVVRVKRPL